MGFLIFSLGRSGAPRFHSPLELHSAHSARETRFFGKFLCCCCTTTTWNILILRFMKNVDRRQRFSSSFSEPQYSPLEFNLKKLTNWIRWNKIDEFWNSANWFLLSDVFAACRRGCVWYKTQLTAQQKTSIPPDQNSAQGQLIVKYIYVVLKITQASLLLWETCAPGR